MKNEIRQLATQIDQHSAQGEAGSMKWLFHPLLQMLTKGEPVTVEDIASETGKPIEEMRKILQTLPSVEINEQGRVVGFGLTLVPTPHRFNVDEKDLYTWCALDTLMFPKLIGQKARIESPCYSTGKPVRLTVEPNRVIKVEPSTTVVSIVTPDDMSSVRTSFCNQVHFFSSPDAAKDWLSQHPEGKVLSVEDAYELGNQMGESYEESGPTNGSCCNI